jgi:hypothetical protein
MKASDGRKDRREKALAPIQLHHHPIPFVKRLRLGYDRLVVVNGMTFWLLGVRVRSELASGSTASAFKALQDTT